MYEIQNMNLHKGILYKPDSMSGNGGTSVSHKAFSIPLCEVCALKKNKKEIQIHYNLHDL